MQLRIAPDTDFLDEPHLRASGNFELVGSWDPNRFLTGLAGGRHLQLRSDSDTDFLDRLVGPRSLTTCSSSARTCSSATRVPVWSSS